MQIGLSMALSAIGNRRRRAVDQTPAAPVNTVAPSITGTSAVGSTLTANRGSWTGYPSISYAYQWQRDTVDISGATASTYTLVSADYETSTRVVVTATNTEGSASANSTAVGPIAGTGPVNTVAPAVTGTTGLGDTLTATSGTWTGYPASFTYAYQWTRNGVDISGATANTRVIATADSGAALVCRVTATNATGSTSANSNSTTAQTFTVPVIAGVPTISGTAEVGQVLTASASSVTGNPTPTRTWQWVRGGVDISGATSITYTLVTADGGTNVSVRQIETNALGSDDATSTTVAVPASGFDAVAEFGSNLVAWIKPVDEMWVTQQAAVIAGSGYVMWQDSAKTSPVTALGQSVAVIADASGNGNDFSTSTSTAEPILDTLDGVVQLLFDGVDDVLTSPTVNWTTDAVSQATVFLKLRKTSDAAAAVPFRINTSTNTYTLAVNAPGLAAATTLGATHRGNSSARTLVTTGYTSPVTAMVTTLSKLASGACELRQIVDGVESTPMTFDAGAGPYANGAMRLGDGHSSQKFTGGIGGLIVVKGTFPTAGQISAVEAAYAGA